MRLLRRYKLGTTLTFKWYEDWRDEWQSPDNYKVLEGVVDCNDFLGQVIVYNEKENKYYCVYYAHIIKAI